MDTLDLLFLCALAGLLPAGVTAAAGASLFGRRHQGFGLALVTLGAVLAVGSCSALFLWLQFRLPTNLTGR